MALPRERDGFRIHYEKKASWWKKCNALSNALLGNLGPGSHTVWILIGHVAPA